MAAAAAAAAIPLPMLISVPGAGGGTDAAEEGVLPTPEEMSVDRYEVDRGPIDWVFLLFGLAVYTAVLPMVVMLRKFGRSYYPLRIRYPLLSIAAYTGGFLWFAAQVAERQLLLAYDSVTPSASRCWMFAILRYTGIGVFVNTMICKQYHQYRAYVVVDPSPRGMVVLVAVLAVPFVGFVVNPYSYHLSTCAGAGCRAHGGVCLICGDPNLMWRVLAGYLTFLLIPFALLVRSLNDPCSYFPNMPRSLVELGALFVMAGACNLMAWTAPLPTATTLEETVFLSAPFAVSLFTCLSICLPVGVFLFCMLNPLYRFWTNDKEYARRLEQDMRVNVHLQTPRSGILSSSQKSIPTGVGGRAEFFEVERLAAHVESGDPEQVKKYLAQTNVSIIHPIDSDGLTPLHRAIRNRYDEIAELLLNLGADADGRDAEGATPLCAAARRGHVDGIYLLHRYGANLNASMRYHATAAHVAVEYKQMAALSLLLSLGANVTPPGPTREDLVDDDDEGWNWYNIHIHGRGWMRHHYKSPLTLAAELDYYDFVTLLAETTRTAPVTVCSHGWNVLQLCCALGHLQIVEYLSERPDVLDFVAYTNPKDSRNVFHYCCMMGRDECLDVLLDQFDVMPPDADFDDYPGEHSSRGLAPVPVDLHARWEMRDKLLNAQDYLGRTPLHYAVLGRHTSVVEALLRGRVVTHLPDCAKGTRVKDTPSTSSFSTSYFAVQPCRGMSPLEYARLLNCGRIMELLLRAEPAERA